MLSIISKLCCCICMPMMVQKRTFGRHAWWYEKWSLRRKCFFSKHEMPWAKKPLEFFATPRRYTHTHTKPLFDSNLRLKGFIPTEWRFKIIISHRFSLLSIALSNHNKKGTFIQYETNVLSLFYITNEVDKY